MNPPVRLSLTPPLRLFATAALACFAVVGSGRAATRGATLEAIHHLENPRDSTRPGPCGELGAYQFREATWRMHTSMPFALALERDKSDAIAVLHYEWIRHGLEQARVAPTTYNIALAWNGGLEAAIRGTSPARARDYARRVTNLSLVFERDSQVIDRGTPIAALSR